MDVSNGTSNTAQPSRALETVPIAAVPKPHGKIPNTPLASATVSFLLGAVFSLGVYTLFTGGLPRPSWMTYQLGAYLAAWSAFHWGEFAVTAGWNREKCSVDSFLLDNGSMYHIAHSLAVSEYLVSLYLKPSWKAHPYISAIGLVMVLTGWWLRSLAMVHAATNFSHTLAYRKLSNHELVTDGIYSWFRHPSYAGFFYWALGTQLLLQNPLSFIIFFALLWKFFSQRIKVEEKSLVNFFGQSYVDYRRRVGVMIPFIQ
ncbi:ICMT-domain-containing protein [Amylostereum chailletii]|nr:ICMT-domain-containing protein [Amylostereum chailletii]